ncbi:hypothetical protein PMIN06_006674 [Paraphaeosphaeria minitans]
MSNQDSQNQLLELPSPTVLLVAGQVSSSATISRNSVRLPVATAEKSAYLGACMQPLAVHGNDITIDLPDVEPAALRLYVLWLQYEDAPLHLHNENGPVARPRHTLIWRECFDLIQAHLLGSKFGDGGFQRYILGQLEAWLDPEQNPDPELLDYFWEKAKDIGDELLCFIMARMFQIRMEKADMLVSWMKGFIEGRRMMEYIEGIRESGRSHSEMSKRKTSKGPKSNPEKVKEVRRVVSTAKRGDCPTVEEVVPLQAISRERTPPELYRKDKVEVPTFGGDTQQNYESESPATAKEHCRPQSEKTIYSPKSKTLAVPKRKPTQRASTPQAQVGNLPQALRIHPKALTSTANTNIHAEMGRQRTSSPYPHFAMYPSGTQHFYVLSSSKDPARVAAKHPPYLPNNEANPPIFQSNPHTDAASARHTLLERCEYPPVVALPRLLSSTSQGKWY